MESSPVKPIVASNMSLESLQKYEDEISALSKGNGWSPSSCLYLYKGFWFHPILLTGVLYARDNFEAQPSDVFLCSFMKTGCTWLKALSFYIATRTQFDDSTSPLRTLVPHYCVPFLERGFQYLTTSGVKTPLFGSHLPYTLLPKSIIDSGCKIVYLCRDPKDTFVSLWNFFRKAPGMSESEDQLVSLKEGFELFCKGLCPYGYGPYWDHVLGYWKASLERPEKILFLKYEDMKEDTEACVKKLADFFGCPFSIDEEKQGMVQKIIKFCSFESLSNLEVNKTGKTPGMIENNAVFRKGKVGDWRNCLNAGMGERLDNVMEEKLTGSGLTFKNSY
ncbi:hypothetical protein COLO4_13189 [Corchorus olitorius]|uniref:Sulfotransferase n=1 Tax=Corchorus olitorius TaxID=93759 RepID=A0A1R3JXM1_9ROSI|nr:hypothetical protein COLO4_13189 [Corchorus olitorius]